MASTLARLGAALPRARPVAAARILPPGRWDYASLGAPRRASLYACRCQVHSGVEVGPASELKDGEISFKNWKIKMLYDGDCPLCMREVNMLKERNKSYGAIKFVDISLKDYSPEDNQDGLGKKVNEQGVAFYNDLINFMIEKGIEPYATLYHWDLPHNLQETLGGWLSDKIVEYFALYAEACFANFGDRVKHWITINEPLQTAVNGYGIGHFAPGGCDGQTARCYLAAHHQILAHAAAVDVYRRKFKAVQGGEVGLVDCEWAEPFSEKMEDQIAAERRLEFQLGWYRCCLYFLWHMDIASRICFL